MNIKDYTVCWNHLGNMPESLSNTEISFQIEAEENQAFLRFTLSNWNETTDFMANCNTKWAVFLLNLKDALENGKGNPFS
jgi:hypothetical protein